MSDKRVMLTVQDMTEPSKPGRQHIYSVSASEGEIRSGLSVWLTAKLDVIFGKFPIELLDIVDDREEEA